MRLHPCLAAMISGLLLTPLALRAETPSEAPSAIRLFGRLGYSAGGEKLASGQYANSSETYRISAGGGTSTALGAELRLGDKWAVQLTTGAQKDKTNSTNGEINFARSAKELVGFYSLSPQWRIGAGVRQDSDVKFNWRYDSSGTSGTTEYDNANGTLLEAQYFFYPPNTKAAHSLQPGVSFRVVQQKFKEKTTGKSYDGNQIGVGLFLYY